MDAEDVDPREIEDSFRFIRRVNRWLGGVSSLRRVLAADAHAWPSTRPIRMLDLGTGAADIPLAIDAWGVRVGHAIECVALERHPACLCVARRSVGPHPRIRVVSGDALDLAGLESASFDYVHAGMFLHHLADDDVVRVLAEMGRLASRRVIWNDLLRSHTSLIAAHLLTIGSPSHVRHDATLSVRKGFTPAHAHALAARAGLDPVVRVRTLVGRIVVTAEAPRGRTPSASA